MPIEPKTPDVELIEAGVVRVKCRECGTLIRLCFGDLTRSEAEEALAKQDYRVFPASVKNLWQRADCKSRRQPMIRGGGAAAVAAARVCR